MQVQVARVSVSVEQLRAKVGGDVKSGSIKGCRQNEAICDVYCWNCHVRRRIAENLHKLIESGVQAGAILDNIINRRKVSKLYQVWIGLVAIYVHERCRLGLIRGHGAGYGGTKNSEGRAVDNPDHSSFRKKSSTGRPT